MLVEMTNRMRKAPVSNIRDPARQDTVRAVRLERYLSYARRCGGRSRLVALDEAAGYMVSLLQSQRNNATLYAIWSEISSLTGDKTGALGIESLWGVLISKADAGGGGAGAGGRCCDTHARGGSASF